MNETPFFPQGILYTDERCEKVATALERNPEFSGFSVWKAHPEGEFPSPSDRYLMFTHDGSIVGVETWEIDKLNDDELLAYLSAQSKRGNFSTAEKILLSLGSSMLAITLLFVPFWNISMSITIITWFIVLLLFLVSLVLFYGFRRKSIERIRKTDCVMSSESPLLVNALQKLASNTDIPLAATEKYAKRLKAIEDEMASH